MLKLAQRCCLICHENFGPELDLLFLTCWAASSPASQLSHENVLAVGRKAGQELYAEAEYGELVVCKVAGNPAMPVGSQIW